MKMVDVQVLSLIMIIYLSFGLGMAQDIGMYKHWNGRFLKGLLMIVFSVYWFIFLLVGLLDYVYQRRR